MTMMDKSLLFAASVVLFLVCLVPLAYGYDLDETSEKIFSDQHMLSGEKLVSVKRITEAQERESDWSVTDPRCFGKHNSTCLGIYADSSCRGEYVGYDCIDPKAVKRYSPEERSCSDLSYKVYSWKQIATNAATPTNNFYTANDGACESQCYNYLNVNKIWVVGWTRDWNTGNCQCFVTPYSNPNNAASAVNAQATTGFFKNNNMGSSCGSHTMRYQKIWSGVVWSGMTAGYDLCMYKCRAFFGVDVSTFRENGATCYCLNNNWLGNPMTYTPTGDIWSLSFNF